MPDIAVTLLIVGVLLYCYSHANRIFPSADTPRIPAWRNQSRKGFFEPSQFRSCERNDDVILFTSARTNALYRFLPLSLSLSLFLFPFSLSFTFARGLDEFPRQSRQFMHVDPLYAKTAAPGRSFSARLSVSRSSCRAMLNKTARMIIDGWIKQYDKYSALDRSSWTNEFAPDSVREAPCL